MISKEPALYDDAGIQTPEPQFYDLSSLGELRDAHCTNTCGVFIFEHGSFAITRDTWKRFQEVFAAHGGA